MAIGLIVREPFGGYAKGTRIVDPAVVDEILSSENEHHVVKVAVSDDEAAALARSAKKAAATA